MCWQHMKAACTRPNRSVLPLATLSQLHNILAVQRQQQPQDSSSTYIALTTLHPVPWPDTSAPMTPTRKAQSPAFRRAPPAGSLLDPSSGRPITTPPGFGFPTPAGASAGASAGGSSRQQRRAFKAEHTDLYTVSYCMLKLDL